MASSMNLIWVELAKLFDEKEEHERQGFDVIGAFTIVFNDIQKHGMSENTSFAEGWLCPIYKMDISNYRPITVLNTDYKIMTKALAAHRYKREFR